MGQAAKNVVDMAGHAFEEKASQQEPVPKYLSEIDAAAAVSIVHVYSFWNHAIGTHGDAEIPLPCYDERNKINLRGDFTAAEILTATKARKSDEDPRITALRRDLVRQIEDAKIFEAETRLEEAEAEGFKADGYGIGILAYDEAF